MATVSIRSSTDIARTRNTIHKLLLAQRCSPNLAARSVAAMTILTESVLRLGVSIILDVGVIFGSKDKVVELSCVLDLVGKTTFRANDMEQLLMLVVNDVQMRNHNHCLSIYMRLW